MKENYSIEDLTFQMEGMAVYKAKGKDGLAYALTVLTYTEEVICRLNQPKFDKGLGELVALSHHSLTKVVEGGVDERDQQVWVTHRWNAGRPLEDIVTHRPVEAAELHKLKEEGDSMIEILGDRANVIAFDPRFIFLGRTSGGELVTKYVIDYWQWFRDWALGAPFGGGRDAEREMVKLFKSLDAGGGRSQIRLPSIPAPTPKSKGPMIVLPGDFAGPEYASPSVVEAPAPEPVAPPPPQTRRLVTGLPSQPPAPLPTPQLVPAPPPTPPRTTRQLVTAAAVPAPATPVAQFKMPTMLVTTSVPAHAEPAQTDAAAVPAPALTRSLVMQEPAKAPLSPPRTKTAATLSSSGSGGGKAILAILGLIIVLGSVAGFMYLREKNKASVVDVPKKEERDKRLGPELVEPAPEKIKLDGTRRATAKKEPAKEGAAREGAAREEPAEKVSMAKPEPRPFVPIAPVSAKVEPRPADPTPAVEPVSEPKPVVKKLPEVSPGIRPDVSQITDIAAADTAALAAKVSTWVRIKGQVVTTSVDGDWAFAGENQLVAQLRDGQLAVLKNQMVEVLGWLEDERTLIVAEDFDISYADPGPDAPVEAIEEPAPAGKPEEKEDE